jgi:hypothetical protein
MNNWKSFLKGGVFSLLTMSVIFLASHFLIEVEEPSSSLDVFVLLGGLSGFFFPISFFFFQKKEVRKEAGKVKFFCFWWGVEEEGREGKNPHPFYDFCWGWLTLAVIILGVIGIIFPLPFPYEKEMNAVERFLQLGVAPFSYCISFFFSSLIYDIYVDRREGRRIFS